MYDSRRLSKTYQNLPGGIMSTIPRRPSLRESWMKPEIESGDKMEGNYKTDEAEIVDDNRYDESRGKFAMRNGLMNLGYVKTRKAFFETLPNAPNSKANSDISMESEQTEDHYEIVKYKVKYPLWKDYNADIRIVDRKRHTCSDFPKWEEIAEQRGVTDDGQDVQDNQIHVRNRKVSRVQSLRGKFSHVDDNNYYEIKRKANRTVLGSLEVTKTPAFADNIGMVFEDDENQGTGTDSNDISSTPADDNPLSKKIQNTEAPPTQGCYASFPVSDRRDTAACTSVCVSPDHGKVHFQHVNEKIIETDSLVQESVVKMGKSDSDILPSEASYDNRFVYRGKKLPSSEMRDNVDNSLSERTVLSKPAPRVVSAALKSYTEIPEELFNSLAESSVDPSPPHEDLGDEDMKEKDWVQMREGRRALLQNSVLSPSFLDAGRGRIISPSDRTSISSIEDDTVSDFSITPKKDKIFNSTMIKDDKLGSSLNHISSLETTPKKISKIPISKLNVFNSHQNVDMNISETEKKLRAAGVYFRVPGDDVKSPGERVGPQLEVIGTSVSNNSSIAQSSSWSNKSESLVKSAVREASQVAPGGGTRSHSSAQYARGNHGVESELKQCSAKMDGDGEVKNPLVPIVTYSERNKNSDCNGKEDIYIVHQQPKSVSVLINNFKNVSTHPDLERDDSFREPLNLIEEVIVPESSVAMKAFFPTVEYSTRNQQVTHFPKNKPIDKPDGKANIHHHHLRGGDSDSGHGSGTTSPCGNLTDPPSPPPSPPDPRHHNSSSSSQNNQTTNVSTTKLRQSSSCSVTCNDHVSVLTCSPSQTVNLPNETQQLNSPSSVSAPIDSGAVVASVPNEVTITCNGGEQKDPHYVVVAIDFGTTYSGYAFSFLDEPNNIHIMKRWEGGDPGVQNQKTPTIVLLNPDRTFHSLGFTARDHYHDLDPIEASRWHYFDKFKMQLHDNKSLNRDTLLTAANGTQVPALEIFSHALRYFKDHALRELREEAPTVVVPEGAVRWVVTVPAIWSHPAKQFMRTASYMAGLASSESADQLLIALEPEAAAIYCRKLHKNQLVHARPLVLRENRASSSTRPLSIPTATSNRAVDKTRPYSTYDQSVKENNSHDRNGHSRTVSDWLVQDTVYMVVDCGGGTVDITVHQMTDSNSGHLKELHKATGGPYGSTGVDKQFEKLLDSIFGTEFMETFKQQRPAAFVDLMIAFESRKRNVSPERSTPLNIALPFSFIDLYKKTTGTSIETALSQLDPNTGVEWSQGMLRVSQHTMLTLFSDTLHSIQQSIEGVVSLLEREASTGNSSALQFMFLVGGFSESELVQQYIRDQFSQRVTVIIPQGMGLAILRGAVEYGLDPTVVTVRRSRLTCGVGVLNRYVEGVHPEDKRVYAAGTHWCADVLDVFVRVDESVAVGDVVSRSYTPATKGQPTVVLHLYATTGHNNMHFVSDPGVGRVGTLLLDLKDTWPASKCGGDCPCCSGLCGAVQGGHCLSCKEQRREISVHMKFGGTEVKASAVDHLTGKCVKANFDFLSL